MAEHAGTRSDRAVGLAMVLGILAGVAAIGMALTAGEPISGVAFGAAVLLAGLAVVAVHVYQE